MIILFERDIPQLERTIRIHLHLPADYDTSMDRYPVIYMFDGQNLFFDEYATFGTSWGLESFLKECPKQFIVVGLECDHRGNNRMLEYSPYPAEVTPYGPSQGKGELLMDWLVHSLKPEIDFRLRTWPQREATAIAGSSMGGLMAMYGVLHYNELFSKAACLSPSLFTFQDELYAEMLQRTLDPDTRVYWSFGTEELPAKRREEAEQMLLELSARLSQEGGLGKVDIIEGGRHNEETWRSQNPRYFEFLWEEPEEQE